MGVLGKRFTAAVLLCFRESFLGCVQRSHTMTPLMVIYEFVDLKLTTYQQQIHKKLRPAHEVETEDM